MSRRAAPAPLHLAVDAAEAAAAEPPAQRRRINRRSRRRRMSALDYDRRHEQQLRIRRRLRAEQQRREQQRREEEEQQRREEERQRREEEEEEYDDDVAAEVPHPEGEDVEEEEEEEEMRIPLLSLASRIATLIRRDGLLRTYDEFIGPGVRRRRGMPSVLSEPSSSRSFRDQGLVTTTRVTRNVRTDLPRHMAAVALKALWGLNLIATRTPGREYMLSATATRNTRETEPVGTLSNTSTNEEYSELFLRLYRVMARLYAPDAQEPDTVSGMVIPIGVRGTEVFLRIQYGEQPVLRRGHMWSEELDQEIRRLYNGAEVLIPKNPDYGCMWYALAASYLYFVVNEQHRATFSTGEKRDGMCPTMLQIAAEAKNSTIVKKCLEKAQQEIDRHLLECYVGYSEEVERVNMKECADMFKDIEKNILEETAKLSVYIVKCDRAGRYTTYPVYISNLRDKPKMYIINYISEGLDKAHFIVPLSKNRYFGTKGLARCDFWVCQVCGLVCFTRGELMTHVHLDENGQRNYGWNERFTSSTYAAVGACKSCSIRFESYEEFDYHCNAGLGGCFTSAISNQGRGYRNVVLSERTHLLTAYEDREKYDEITRMDSPAPIIVFADFESCINPDSGEHTLLRWGMWAEELRGPQDRVIQDHYQSGVTITDFFKALCKLGSVDDILVWFHNGSGYDFAYIFTALMNEEYCKGWEIGGIMKGANKWQQIRVKLGKRKITFKDTYQFLTLSLAKLVECAKKNSDGHVFDCYYDVLKEQYGDRITPEMMKTITQKNSLPYTYFTSPAKMGEPIENILATLSAEEREVATNLQFTKVGEWLELYLLSDVLQLRCVFMEARKQLAISHHVMLDRYVGMPSTTWNAWIISMIKDNPDSSSWPKIPLYYTDASTALFFKRMVRGGISCVSKRKAESDATHTILYLDVNGLYPHVMQRKYPAGEMYTVVLTDGAAADADSVQHLCDEWHKGNKVAGMAGAAFEVDMYLPDKYHDLFKQYPMAPEHVYITEDQYKGNEYLKMCALAQTGTDELMHTQSFRGLAATLWPKTHYQVHWRVLRWYMKMGMVVTRVHRFVYWTEEQDYLSEYVKKNIRLRDQNTDELTRTLYKMMGNSLYGKTFENPFKHTGVSVVTNEVKLCGLLQHGRVHSIIYQGENGTLVRHEGEKVEMNKPTYIGAIVTEYAKLHMYKIFYEHLNKVFPLAENKMELLYTDTDSFIVRVEHNPSLKTSEGNISRLLAYINEKCGKELIGTRGGLIKSETGEDDYIQDFCGLRAKVYAYRTFRGKKDQRAKGTTRDAQSDLDYERYVQALEGGYRVVVPTCRIDRTHFELHSVTQERTALSANDGKRWICSNGYDTLPFGHYSLRPSHSS